MCLILIDFSLLQSAETNFQEMEFFFFLILIVFLTDFQVLSGFAHDNCCNKKPHEQRCVLCLFT